MPSESETDDGHRVVAACSSATAEPPERVDAPLSTKVRMSHGALGSRRSGRASQWAHGPAAAWHMAQLDSFGSQAAEAGWSAPQSASHAVRGTPAVAGAQARHGGH